MDKLNSFSTKIIDWFAVFGPKLIGALLVLVIGLALINMVVRLVSKAMNRPGIDVSLQTFMRSIVSVGLKILLLISVAGIIGIQTTSFVAVIGALGLAVGLALQGSLGNFAGGVLILVFKPFKVGDLIEAGGQTGHVQEIQIFNTILLTPENKTVILANGGVSNGTIINYSRHGNLRVDITMSVAPENNIEKVRQITMETMDANKFVLKDPAPTVTVLKVGDGMITLAIRPFATPENYWDAFFTVQEEVKMAWDQNNVTEPVPARIILDT